MSIFSHLYIVYSCRAHVSLFLPPDCCNCCHSDSAALTDQLKHFQNHLNELTLESIACICTQIETHLLAKQRWTFSLSLFLSTHPCVSCFPFSPRTCLQSNSLNSMTPFANSASWQHLCPIAQRCTGTEGETERERESVYVLK